MKVFLNTHFKNVSKIEIYEILQNKIVKDIYGKIFFENYFEYFGKIKFSTKKNS